MAEHLVANLVGYSAACLAASTVVMTVVRMVHPMVANWAALRVGRKAVCSVALLAVHWAVSWAVS